MKKQLNIRFVYDVNHMVFNVDSDGPKKNYDPIFKKYYIYASAANVKHNIKEMFKQISEINSPTVLFEKNFDPKKFKNNGEIEEQQGGCATEINVLNPYCCIFGAWNASGEKENTKYSKAAITSALEISEFKPIHTLLSSILRNETGVHVGDENSKIAAIFDGKKCLTPEELSEIAKQPIDVVTNFFNNTRKMNIYQQSSANGIYFFDICINMDDFGRYCITDNPDLFTQENLDFFVSQGMEIKTLNNKKYIYYPKNKIKEYFKYFISALFNWEFTSNVSLHGSKPNLLRVSFTDSNPSIWKQATAANLNSEDSAELLFIDNLENNGVFSYNTLMLKKYLLTDNASIDAENIAFQKLINLGNKFIDEQ